MTAARLPLLIAGLAFLVSCSSVSVKEDYNPSTDFSVYKTYSLYTAQEGDKDPLAANPIARDRLYRAADKELSAKGLRKVDGQGDLVVVIVAGVQQKAQVEQYGGYGWYGRGGYTSIDYYNEGTVVVDLVDAAKKELVWRGTGTGTLPNSQSAEDAEYNTQQAMQKILANFPPAKK